MRLIWILLFFCASAAAQGLQVRADRVEGKETIHDWGSGVYVSKSHVLTCAHTLEGNDKVFILVKDGWAQCKVIRLDKKNDLALLETRVNGDAVELANIPALAISGSPAKFPPELMKIRETPAVLDCAYIRAAVDVGDSGAPVMADGRLIGIVKKKVEMDDTTYAQIVGADVIAEFLK